ncbi:MAG: alpha/beta hydrolase [Isosphaeraceae bacterium]
MNEPTVDTQRASDGYEIRISVWPAADTPRGRVVILHGIQSHAGWYQNLGQTLASHGYETHFLDRRGSGKNSRDRGHAPSMKRLVDDIAERLHSLRQSDPRTPIILAGISWGGKTALLTAAREPSLLDALVLICPGIKPRIGVPFTTRLRIAFALLTNSHKTFPLPLNDPGLFTANPEKQRFIANDPLTLRIGTAGLLASSALIDRALRRIPSKVTQPALLMLAGRDRIIDNPKTLAYFSQLASPENQVVEYPEAHHTLEFELAPQRYALDLLTWLDRRPWGTIKNDESRS